jgi:hypothetical protein
MLISKVSVIGSNGNGLKNGFSTFSGDMEEPHFLGKSDLISLFVVFYNFLGKSLVENFGPWGVCVIFFARLACWDAICVTGQVFGLLLFCLVVGFGLWVLHLMLSGYVSFICHTNREALFYINAHACAKTHAFHACIL